MAEIIPYEPEQVMLLREIEISPFFTSPFSQTKIAMTIYCNEKAFAVDNNISLLLFLQQNKFTSQKGIAVAVNNRIAPQTSWENHILKEGDKVLIIQATKGG